MGLQAKWVYSDVFAAGKLAGIQYKVFVVRSQYDPSNTNHASNESLNDQYLGPSSEDILLRAETAMLSDNQPVSIVHGELWTFSLDSSPPADPPSTLARDLTAVAHGVLLPPFTQDYTSARYLPLLGAIEAMCRSRLLRYGLNQFLPFGKSVLLVEDGSVIRIEPSLTTDGDLRLRLISTKAELRPIDAMWTKARKLPATVWILPLGQSARVVGSHPEPPCPPLARAFYSYVRSVRLFPIPLQALEESVWLNVSYEGWDLMWPASLAVTGPPLDKFSLGTNRSYSALEARLKKDRVFDSMGQKSDRETSVAANSGSANTASSGPNTALSAATPPTSTVPAFNNNTPHPALTPGNPSTEAARLHQRIHPPPAPPPSPLPPSHPQHYGPHFLSNLSYRRPNRQDETAYPTPMYHSPAPASTPMVLGTPAALENLYDNEWGDEVTNADFNFFDGPVESAHPESSKSSTMREDSEMNCDSLHDSQKLNELEKSFENDLEATDGTQDSEQLDSSEPGAFACIKFDNGVYGNLDSKYSAGGRYFYPRKYLGENGEDLEDAVVDLAHDGENERINHEYKEEPQDDDVDDDDDIDDEYDYDNEADIDIDGLGEMGVPSSPLSSPIDVMTAESEALDPDWDDISDWRGLKERKKAFFDDDDSQKILAGWSAALSTSLVTPPSLPVIDSVSIDNLQLLMAQVVWDGGLLSDLHHAPIESSVNAPADSVVAHCLRSLFPPLRCLSIAELQSSAVQASGADTRLGARPSSPANANAALGMSLPPTPGSMTPIVEASSLSHHQQPHQLLQQDHQQDIKLLQQTHQQQSPLPRLDDSQIDLKQQHSQQHTSQSVLGHAIARSNTSSPPIQAPLATPSKSSSTSNEDQFALLSPPLYSFKRGGQLMKARAAILRMWRTLDLHPTGPPRDISLIAMMVAAPETESRARILLDALANCYESCGLGKLNLPTFGDVKDGLFMIQADLRHTSIENLGDVFEIACAQLKRQLLAIPSGRSPLGSNGQLCISMAWPRGLSLAASPLPLARGFQAMRTAFPSARWLLLPLDFVVGSDVVLSQFRLVRLALLLYDRWVSRTTVAQPQASELDSNGPAVMLAHLASQSIQLRYASKAPPRVLDDEPVMHVAYGLSSDRRWVAVAWSDQWARTTKIAVLRLSAGGGHNSITRAASPATTSVTAQDTPVPVPGAADPTQNNSSGTVGAAAEYFHDGGTLRSLHTVFGEIWRKTTQVCASLGPNRLWHVSIVKCGRLDPRELGLWQRLPGIKPGELGVFYLPQPRGLNTVYKAPPPLQQQVITPRNPDSEIVQSVAVSTPSSRPATPTARSAMTAPPHPQSHSGSPSASAKDDSVLVSTQDETHGLAYSIKVPCVGSEAPSLATGFLVMPSGPHGQIQLEVNLAHTAEPQAKRVMSRTLGQYRRLASFSETMGVSADATIQPWHVGAVNKMTAFFAASVLT